MIDFFRRRETLLGATLVALLAVATYANTWGNDFVWADQTVIVEGHAILHGAGDLARVFVKPLWSFTGAPSAAGGGYYRPVTAISYTIDHAFWGLTPAGYHVTNTILHAAVTLFLFLFFTRLFPKSRAPLLAAVLFAVHPAHTEAISWVSGRTGLLAALGVAVSLYLYARSRDNSLALAGSLAAFAFGLGAKESAAVLPLLVLLTRFRIRERGRSFFAWNREGLYFALLAVYLAVRHAALGAFGTGNPQMIPAAVLAPTMLRVLGGYFRLLLLPYPLSTNDAVRLSTFVLDPRAFIAAAVLAASVVAALRYGKKSKATAFGLAWTGIALLPFLNIFPLLHFRAERLLYLPSAGFLLAAAALLDLHAGRIVGKERRFGLAPGELLVALLALVLAFGTIARNRTWSDDYRLFTDTLSKSAYAPEARYMLGTAAYRSGAYEDAVRLYRASLTLDPAWVAYLPVPWALANLGFAEYKADDPEGAAASFREALRLYPGMEKATFGTALAASAVGAHEEAIRVYRAILAGDESHEDARYNLAVEYEAVDSLGRAEEEYRELVRLDPGRKDAFVNLGSLLARTGRYSEALEAYRGALRAAPLDAKVHYNIGLLFAIVGEKRGAMEALRTVLALEPENEDARLLLDEISADTTDLPPPPLRPGP